MVPLLPGATAQAVAPRLRRKSESVTVQLYYFRFSGVPGQSQEFSTSHFPTSEASASNLRHSSPPQSLPANLPPLPTTPYTMFSRAVRPALRAGGAAVARPAPANAAGFATLREIEGRLKSIKNIEKITNTMKIVASTRLTRAQKAMDDSRVYGHTSNTVFEQAETKPLEDKKTLLVIASSDKGLCGGIHSGLSKAARRYLATNPNVDIAILGEKAKAQLSRAAPEKIVLSFANVCKDIPTFADAQAIADQIALLPEDYASVRIIYNSFVNAQSYEPTTIEAYSEEAITQSANISSYEVDDEALSSLREYALANNLFWAMAEGHACEISARRNAMENASKNAGEMINKFQILYNRQRQAAITGELVEIITGATASADM
ncbi:unnamed protein product [Penicillium bialowiezense]